MPVHLEQPPGCFYNGPLPPYRCQPFRVWSMSTDSGEINALQGAGKSGVDSGIVPFNMKGLLCRILTYLTLEFEMGGGDPVPLLFIPSKWPCVQEGWHVLQRLRAHGQEDPAETLNAFPYEKETRVLDASFCLCDQRQGEKALHRYWPKALWSWGGFTDLNGKHRLRKAWFCVYFRNWGVGSVSGVE